MKCTVNFMYNNESYQYKCDCYLLVKQLKEIASKTYGISINNIVLKHNGKEMIDDNTLSYYFYFDSKEDIFISITTKDLDNSKVIINSNGDNWERPQRDILNGLDYYQPKRAEEGMGGTYFLRDLNGNNIYCFKPQDEEPMAPNNPHNLCGELGSPGLRPAIRSGWSCIREVAAYMMDINNFAGVPCTALAEITSDSFCYNKETTDYKKLGSLQQFIESDDLLVNRSSTILSYKDVHRIGLLDIRILNLDRNEENILLQRKKSSYGGYEWKAIPIDHGYSIPNDLNIGWCDWCWFEYPQTTKPFDQEMIDYVKSIDFDKIAKMLHNYLKINDKCIKNLKIAHTWLLMGVTEGLTLYDIAYVMLRHDNNMEEPSILEQCCELASRSTKFKIISSKERGEIYSNRIKINNEKPETPSTQKTLKDLSQSINGVNSPNLYKNNNSDKEMSERISKLTFSTPQITPSYNKDFFNFNSESAFTSLTPTPKEVDDDDDDDDKKTYSNSFGNASYSFTPSYMVESDIVKQSPIISTLNSFQTETPSEPSLLKNDPLNSLDGEFSLSYYETDLNAFPPRSVPPKDTMSLYKGSILSQDAPQSAFFPKDISLPTNKISPQNIVPQQASFVKAKKNGKIDIPKPNNTPNKINQPLFAIDYDIDSPSPTDDNKTDELVNAIEGEKITEKTKKILPDYLNASPILRCTSFTQDLVNKPKIKIKRSTTPESKKKENNEEELFFVF